MFKIILGIILGLVFGGITGYLTRPSHIRHRYSSKYQEWDQSPKSISKYIINNSKLK